MAMAFWLWPGVATETTLPNMNKIKFDDQDMPKKTGGLANKRPRWPFRTTGMAVLALALVASVWTAYWLSIAERVETGINDWIADQQRKGGKVSYKSLEMSGFPFWLNVRMEGASMLIERGHSLEWRPPVLTARIRPWRPAKVDVDLRGLHQLIGESRVDLMSRELGAVIHVQRSGAWRSTLKGEDVSAEFSRFGTLSAKRIAIDVHWGSKWLEAGQSPLGLDFAGENIQLPAAWLLPLGNDVTLLRLTASVAGQLTSLRDPDVLIRWRDDGGALELNRFSLEYGPLHLDGDGTFALDDDLQPMGAFAARVEGFMETLDALRSRNIIGIRQASAAKLVLMVLADQPLGRSPHIKVPLTLQDQEVTLKSLMIMKVPRIDWSHVFSQRVP